MRCPFCHDLENRVVDSRLGKDGDAIRRRRHCEHCGRRFTTYERVEESLPQVVKKDGRRERFDRRKIVEGLKVACRKRPVASEDIEAQLVDLVGWERPNALAGMRSLFRTLKANRVVFVDPTAGIRVQNPKSQFRFSLIQHLMR